VTRIEAASRYFSPPGTPDEWRARLSEHIPERPEGALLHLDLRPHNIHIDGSDIVSVLDYSNALIGDPWFELARIKVSGLLDASFIEGYGLSAEHVESHAGLLNAYGLDTSALLCVVADEETHDPELQARMIELTQHQLKQLLSSR
jgi:thiamine kinase-like enzyme